MTTRQLVLSIRARRRRICASSSCQPAAKHTSPAADVGSDINNKRHLYIDEWIFNCQHKDYTSPAADVGSNQSQPQTQHSRCQCPTNHRNSLKQLFLDLISENHKPALLRAISESLLRINSGLFNTAKRRRSSQTPLMQTSSTCLGIIKQQTPALTAPSVPASLSNRHQHR